MLQSKAGYIDARPLTASSAKPLATHGRTLSWVKLRNTQHEQMSSALHPTTDVGLARAKGVTRIDGVGAYIRWVRDAKLNSGTTAKQKKFVLEPFSRERGDQHQA